MTNNKLKKVKMDGNVEMSLYDMNKQIMFQMPELSEEKIVEAKDLITTFNHNNGHKYYMLLCNELKYYTVFNTEKAFEEKLEEVVFECLNNVGTVVAVDPTEDGTAVEIWVKLEEEAKVFYFFGYDKGVIDLV